MDTKRRRLETPAQRQARLARQRVYNQRRRRGSSVAEVQPLSAAVPGPLQPTPSEESSTADQVRPQHSRIQRETESQRSRRLERQRQYNSRRRTAINHSDSAGDASNVGRESQDERQERLARQREYAFRRRLLSRSMSGAQVVSESMPLQHPLQQGSSRQCPSPRENAEDQGPQALPTLIPSQQVTGLQTDDTSSSASLSTKTLKPIVSEVDPFTLRPVTAARVKEISTLLQDDLGGNGLDECVCAVCDRLVLRRSVRRVQVRESTLVASMSRVLKPHTGDLPRSLLDYYDCTIIHQRLHGMLLSREGVRTSDEVAYVQVCEECFVSLSKGGDKPPKHAIANGFYIGLLPVNLFDATWIEKVMTQLVTVVAQTRVMRGGRHRSIRSHCMVFDATPGPPATLLPRRVDRSGPYNVVLAGPMTSQQTDCIRKLHRARGQKVTDLLNFYKTNNVLYDGVVVDQSVIIGLNADSDLLEEVSFATEDEVIGEAIQEDQDSITSHAGAAVEDEVAVIEQNLLLSREASVVNAQFVQRVVDLNPTDTSATPRLRVNHSSQFAASGAIEARMYPHLFPFGRGHPAEPRQTYVSKRDCLRYYAMLSSRRFAQDPTFILTAFARLALENMYMLTSVKCRRFGGVFEGYEALSHNDVAIALLNNERRQRGEPRLQSSHPDAGRFMKSVELGSMSVWGSAAERRQCRQEAFAYQTRFGQPSLFVTLTPNTDNSYAMAHYTGILSVETLFDSLEARIPSDNEMKRAAMADDCASARLFMRTVDAFIRHILGIDPKSGQPVAEGGRFGRTKAYFGMVETQGRGTLHIHFLVWLFGAPVNSDMFEERLEQQGSAFTSNLETYLDSIVTNQLSIPIDDVRCKQCESQGSFVSLPIPASARREKRKRGRADEQLEPLMVKCSACGQESSSQHILRQALMQHRPPHWPPPLAALSELERNERIRRETISRASQTEAAWRIDGREVFQTAMESSGYDEMASWLLQLADSRQLGYQHGDSDQLRQDRMNKLILMTPPSIDGNRMTSMHHAYMISTLVYNLNMHYWTHTGSCFKQSRSGSASVCRYGFPRKTSASSSVTGPSVTVKRSLAHEFVNGYNPTIMEAFKCNHDVQVLFGGKDAIERIYYCCKYVTKPQRLIDSSTAVALASFERRQAKEAAALASQAPPSVTEIRRKRVTSMVHTFTNKQEIAGPLAALYLLRGSCCYSSATCAKLPLSAIIKQIEASGEYLCSLVQSQSTEDTVFTPASQLDDYIFRPESASRVNLYEFTMQCYRRPLSAATPDARRFLESHPLAESHCVAMRRHPAVPIIAGPRLPRFKVSMNMDEKELYAKLVLILFKPFRSCDDILGDAAGDEQPWFTAYSSWEGTRSDFVKTIMSNMNDYHAGRIAEERSVAVATEEDADRDEGQRSDSDVESSDDGYLSEDNDDTEDEFDVVEALDTLQQESSGEQLPVFPAPATFPARISAVLQQFDEHRLLAAIAVDVAAHSSIVEPALSVPIGADQLKKWVVDNATDNKRTGDADGTDATSLSEVLVRETTVTEIIDECLQPSEIRWNATPTEAPPITQTPIYAGIATISRIFTLNELQHGAFALVGVHLLRRWQFAAGDQVLPAGHDQVAATLTDEDLESRQLRMFLGGEGGTGKSRVIQALQELCRSWQRPHSLVVTALTGKAASVVSGRTLAAFEMSLKNANGRAAVQDLDCLIIDEISMMSKMNLLALDRLLQKAKGVPGVLFGGIHVILVGDFLQLPPVGADPLFIDPITKRDASLPDFEGFRLWRRFDKVVVLQESVRFRDDPEWGEGCSSARYGEWTPAFMNMINSRLVNRVAPDQSHEHLSVPASTVYVTPDNDTRTAINGHFITCVGRELGVGEFPVRIVANFKGALNRLSSEDLRMVMGLPDTKFGRMAPYLDLVRGMPIQMTQNVRTHKGVANGSMGVLHSVKFPPGTTFHQGVDRRTGVVFLLPSSRPLFALVRLQRGANAIPIADGVDPALFPVFPDAEPFKATELRLTPSSTGEERLLHLKIQQFPFVCAVGATVYKVQGESLKSMVAIDWKVDTRAANKPQQAYLMVSRVVTRQALISLKPFTQEIAAWSKPPQSAIDEDRRLAAESSRTLSEFYAQNNTSHVQVQEIGVPQ